MITKPWITTAFVFSIFCLFQLLDNMALLLNNIKDSYNFLFHDLADERTRDMFPSPLFLIITLPSYIYFVKSLGPRIMADLKPFKLQTTMYYYNLFQILISVYMLYLAMMGGWLREYSYTCQPVDYTDNPQTRNMIAAAWWYTTVKLIDLMDTIFFVLRKKERQISFLHVFHHSLMPITSFICLKYIPTGHGTLVGVINCVVHIVMYTYYLIAGLGPKYQKYLWWKKHVTTIQLVQFCILFIHNLVALCDSTCSYPKWVNALTCIHSIQFIYLFGKFYYANYIREPKNIKTGTPTSIAKSKKL